MSNIGAWLPAATPGTDRAASTSISLRLMRFFCAMPAGTCQGEFGSLRCLGDVTAEDWVRGLKYGPVLADANGAMAKAIRREIFITWGS